jgi:hypothetical protein
VVTEPSLPARTWDYLSAAGVHWWAGLAILLAAERISERLFHDFWKRRVDPWFTPSRRRQALIFFATCAFLYANFRAFDDVSRAARSADLDAARAAGERDAAKALAENRQKTIDRQATQITILQSGDAQLTTASNPYREARNPDGLYQLGPQVATVTGASVDRGHSEISFQTIQSSGNLHGDKEIE